MIILLQVVLLTGQLMLQSMGNGALTPQPEPKFLLQPVKGDVKAGADPADIWAQDFFG